jgi:hypothetical protein
MRDIHIDQTPVISKGPVWAQQATDMLVRFWPDQQQGHDSFNARFRYRVADQRHDQVVEFHYRRAAVPLTPDQYRLWDLLRTELVLNPDMPAGSHVWTGMTRLPQDMDQRTEANWDQNHVFFAIRCPGRWHRIVSQHFNHISYHGRWDEQQHYLDWRMTSRNPVIW